MFTMRLFCSDCCFCPTAPAAHVPREAPFVPGTGGVRLSWEARPSRGQPPSLLRTYYDNGTLDFVSVRCDSS